MENQNNWNTEPDQQDMQNQEPVYSNQNTESGQQPPIQAPPVQPFEEKQQEPKPGYTAENYGWSNGGYKPAEPYTGQYNQVPPHHQTNGYGPVYSHYGPAGLPPQVVAQRVKKPTRAIDVAVLAVSMAIMMMLAIVLFVLVSIAGTFRALLTPVSGNTTPPSGSFSVVRVEGTIMASSGGGLGINSPSYNHGATLQYIRQLTEDEGNKGILLYMNTPGGSVYEGDELYRALENYKTQTGRPVWVYMAQTCASAGYYVSALADHIIANYGTTTGSIGVYISMTDTSGLYGKLGIETVLVRSGENKGVGTTGVHITEEQRQVFQELVDEDYNRFIQLVSDGRGMDLETVRKLADGRPYSANQALQNGLVDELGDWEMAVKSFEEETGGTAFMPNFSGGTPLGQLLSEVKDVMPRSEFEVALSSSEKLPSGVTLSYMPGLMGQP